MCGHGGHRWDFVTVCHCRRLFRYSTHVTGPFYPLLGRLSRYQKCLFACVTLTRSEGNLASSQCFAVSTIPKPKPLPQPPRRQSPIFPENSYDCCLQHFYKDHDDLCIYLYLLGACSAFFWSRECVVRVSLTPKLIRRCRRTELQKLRAQHTTRNRAKYVGSLRAY